MDDERGLIERAKNDPEAFGILFERHYSPIFGYIFRRIEDWTASKDIASEVFLKAFQGLWRYQWRGIPFSAWLYRIATNEVRMYLRRRQPPVVSLDRLTQELGFDPPDPQSQEAEKLEAERKLREHEDFRRLRTRMLELPLKYQEVLMLRYFERKNVREIAQILAKREGTIKSLLSRGIGRLRNLL